MAKNCKACGKPIAENLDFCSEECMKAYRQKLKDAVFITQFDKGSGSDRRSRNIDKIISLLREGVDEATIKTMLRRYFKPSTADDYLETAKLTMKLEGQG